MHIVYNWGVLRHFNPKKLYKKNRQNSQIFLNYIKSLCIISCTKMLGYSQIIYCLPEESTKFGTKNFELNQAFICPLTCTNPTILVDAMLHALIRRLMFFKMLCVVFIHYIKHDLKIVNSCG